MTLVLDRIDASDIDLLWPYLEPYFQRACEADPTDLTPDIIRREAAEDRRLVWSITDASRNPPLLSVFSTVTDGNKVCIGPLAGDEMELWLPLLSQLESHAKEAGHSVSHIEGRLGWIRVLRPYGYQVTRVVLEKTLNGALVQPSPASLSEDVCNSTLRNSEARCDLDEG